MLHLHKICEKYNVYLYVYKCTYTGDMLYFSCNLCTSIYSIFDFIHIY